MAHFPSRSRSIPRSPSRSTPVIAVGQRVFVNCPGNRSGSVVLMDQSGKVSSNINLADGVEVEVVAWKPGVAGDAHYRVRAPSDAADGWLSVANLRTALVPLPAPEPPAVQATPVTDTGANRFGRRSQTGRPPASRSPTTAEPTLAPDVDGRRFGQHFERERPPASPTSAQPSPTSAQPEPTASPGRRFGQHN